jgi:hypothetical protein
LTSQIQDGIRRQKNGTATRHIPPAELLRFTAASDDVQIEGTPGGWSL